MPPADDTSRVRPVVLVPSLLLICFSSVVEASAQSALSLLAMGDTPFNAEQVQAMEKSADVEELTVSKRGAEDPDIYRCVGAGNRDAIAKLDRLRG
jgi:hypothetical protein